MRNQSRLSLIVLAAVLLGACSPMLAASPADVFGEPSFAPAAPEMAFEQGRAASGTFDVAATTQERLVVQTAALTLVVTDPVASVAAVRALAEAMDGFVVASNVYQSTYGASDLVANYASITIRVPSERLTEALDRIKGDSIQVRSENISGEDVTSQYVDLELRLRNLEAAEGSSPASWTRPRRPKTCWPSTTSWYGCGARSRWCGGR